MVWVWVRVWALRHNVRRRIHVRRRMHVRV
jgi:hypothetical protein